jgi:hypothetical protein
MTAVIAYIIIALSAALLYGSLATAIYFVICKIRKRKFQKRIVLKIYKINLIFWAIISLLIYIISKVPFERFANFLPALIILGIVFFIIQACKCRRRPEVSVKNIKETKCTCQICGNVWYYDKQEYLENKGQKMINSANQNSNCSSDLLCCSGCWPALFIPRAQQVPVKNLNKCPKCNSSAISREEVVHTIPK